MAHAQIALETPSFVRKIFAQLQVIGAFLVRLSETNVRVREVERLSALSDAELAKTGIVREDIVRHVYRGAL